MATQRWLAARDGIGHAQGKGRAIRTACGARALDERHAWPIQRRCEGCVEAVKKLEAAAPARAGG